MKRIVILLAVLVVLMVGVSGVQAQNSRVDLGVIRHITQPFIESLSQGNIAVRTTFQCGTQYRKDWAEGTFMKLTGKAFPFTSASGTADLDMFTALPPMSLEGFRPPMTLHTAPTDADGNIVIGDPGYWLRFRIWQTRPCVRFSYLLRDNAGVASAWNWWISGRTDMHKYVTQWRELGLNDDGSISAYYPGAFTSQYNAPEPLNWSGAPTYLQPNETVQVEDIGEGQVEWVERDHITEIVAGIVVAIILFGVYVIIVVKRNVRELV